MKKKQRNLGSVLSAIIFLIVSMLMLDQPASSQRSDLAVMHWKLIYKVRIEGKGIETAEVGSGGPDIIWEVNRVYTGKAILQNPADSGRRSYQFSGEPNLSVAIHDKVTKKSDPTCEEWTEEVETWDYVAQGHAYYAGTVVFFLSDDNFYYGSHSINFPLDYRTYTLKKGLPNDHFQPRLLVYQKDIFFHPKELVQRGQTEIKPNALNLKIPDVQGWISDQALKRERSRERFDSIASEWIPITTTLLEGVDTSWKVKAFFTYSLTPCNPGRVDNGSKVEQCYKVIE